MWRQGFLSTPMNNEVTTISFLLNRYVVIPTNINLNIYFFRSVAKSFLDKRSKTTRMCTKMTPNTRPTNREEHINHVVSPEIIDCIIWYLRWMMYGALASTCLTMTSLKCTIWPGKNRRKKFLYRRGSVENHTKNATTEMSCGSACGILLQPYIRIIICFFFSNRKVYGTGGGRRWAEGLLVISTISQYDLLLCAENERQAVV